jgi:hypothetical protein
MIIAICGLKRSGKDTVANHILKKCPEFMHTKISDPLKKVCQVLFDFPDVEGPLKDHIDSTWEITPRKAMQFIGTEMMQYKVQELLPNLGRCFWIKKLLMEIKEKRNVVISDLRFKHEVAFLREFVDQETSFLVIKVTRSSCPDSDSHASEQEWKEIKEDFLIKNDGSIEELYNQVDRILETNTRLIN